MKPTATTKMFGNTEVPRDTTMIGLSRSEIISRVGSGMTAPTEGVESLKNPFIVNRRKRNPCLVAQQDFDYVVLEEADSVGLDRVKDDIVDLIAVDEKDSIEFLKNLDSNKKKIRDFLLKEIAPLDIAVGMAVSEVSQELNLITGSPVQQNFKKVNEMLVEIINIRVAEFLSEHLELNSDYLRLIVETFINKQGPRPTDIMSRLLDARQNQNR